jgi:hypothetical protein
MTTRLEPKPVSYRFRTVRGQWLTDEIAQIEALASRSIAEGASVAGAATGARMLLEGLWEEWRANLLELAPLSACAPATEPPRCAPAQEVSSDEKTGAGC